MDYELNEPEETIDLLAGQGEARSGGVSLAILVSVILHILIFAYLIATYHPVSRDAPAPPIARYVQLISQNPDDRKFMEAPGPKINHAPSPNAALSNANRQASTPHPTGEKPTPRPGDGSQIFTPKTSSHPPAANPAQEAANAAPPQPPQPQNATPPTTLAPSTTAFRQPAQTNSGPVNWRNAIKEVGKVASLGGGQQGLDLNGAAGGEKGFAQDGPLSFESSWFDWGDYAEGMVSRIRVNWYANMPHLIQTGLKGVVTIRFTIHRDGTITDVTILQSSGIPPYDFAAKKGIELSSPLNPLPKNFPNETERVTAMFYYNQELPKR
ncbi:MAG TPA: energy transducer TonB [Thermoanaerobaculia bacterium]|nr:energy transducer TonB [Thermoanaerobaculia bacterium]